MMRQQRLVGGDDMLAGLKRRPDKIGRNPAFTTDHLNNNVDIVGCDISRILDPGDPRHVEAAIGGAAARTDGPLW